MKKIMTIEKNYIKFLRETRMEKSQGKIIIKYFDRKCH